jgi:hypothetical protein
MPIVDQTATSKNVATARLGSLTERLKAQAVGRPSCAG